MREIRAERYKTSQARSGDRLEKHNRRKRTQERERKTSFIKYEQKQTYFNGRRKLLSKGSCGALPEATCTIPADNASQKRHVSYKYRKLLKFIRCLRRIQGFCAFLSQWGHYTPSFHIMLTFWWLSKHSLLFT